MYGTCYAGVMLTWLEFQPIHCPLGYERVYLPLCEVGPGDTPFHIEGDALISRPLTSGKLQGKNTITLSGSNTLGEITNGYSAVRSQNAVSAYFTGKQIIVFRLCEKQGITIWKYYPWESVYWKYSARFEVTGKKYHHGFLNYRYIRLTLKAPN